jgi:hypothetical protein
VLIKDGLLPFADVEVDIVICDWVCSIHLSGMALPVHNPSE